MKVALVHDWLPVFSGAEQVLSAIIQSTGPIDLYTLFNFLDDGDLEKIGAKEIFTSYLDRLPFRENYYRYTFPFCPAAIENFDLADYDLVLSSSAAFAKGVIVHPHQRHIAYVHTAVRYAWDQTFEYMRRTAMSRLPFGPILRQSLHKLRIWDFRSAQGADVLLANSSVVQRRIEQIYGRRSYVLHPPVDVVSFPMQSEKDDYYVCASRLVPYKRFDLVVDAFKDMPNRKLIVCGDGPELNRLKERAGPNVTFAGHLPRADLIRTISHARAFIFPAYEDFGIVMAEALSSGTPVIAFQRGGAQDIVVPHGERDATGVLFPTQTAKAIIDAVDTFESDRSAFSPEACHTRANLFASHNFNRKLDQFIALTMDRNFSRNDVLTVD